MIPADLLDAWAEDILTRRLYGPRLSPGDVIRAPEGTHYTVIWVRGLSVRVRRQASRRRNRTVPPGVTISLSEAMKAVQR